MIDIIWKVYFLSGFILMIMAPLITLASIIRKSKGLIEAMTSQITINEFLSDLKFALIPVLNSFLAYQATSVFFTILFASK